MNWKKLSVFSVLSLIAILMTSMLVSAVTANEAGTAVTNTIDGIKQVGEPIFNFLFGASTDGGQLAIQILAFILVLVVVYGVFSAVDIFQGRTWLNFILGLVIAIIGIRFLPENLLASLTAPSSAFVAILFLGLPFLALFFTLQRIQNSFIRRAVWAGYAALILVLVLYKWGIEGSWQSWNWIYVAIIAACIIAFWFDGTLKKWLGGAKAKRGIVAATSVQMDRQVAKINDLKTRLGEATDAADRKKILKDIKRETANLNALEGS